jgi:hypothetical protein
MSLRLEDFIPTFLEQDDPKIQFEMAKRQEFAELVTEPREEPPAPGEFYRHQIAFQRLLHNTNSCLCIHETGTGKSCSVIGLTEYYKHHTKQIKRIYVIERGPSTADEFQRQIAFSCTKGDYIPDRARKPDISSRERKKAITSEVSRWYSIMKYSDFTKEVTAKTDDEISEDYSGCIFVVDEAHGLRNDPTNRGSDTEGAYNALWRVFHLIQRSKIIIMTATPMINSVREVAIMMNLILPADQQMPINWDYNLVTRKQLEPFFRGRISYIRSQDNGVRPNYQGEFIQHVHEVVRPTAKAEKADYEFFSAVAHIDPVTRELKYTNVKQPEVETETVDIESQVVIEPLDMVPGGIQEATYTETIGGRGQGDQLSDKSKQASIMVFPNGQFGGNFPRTNSKAKADYGIAKYVESLRKDEYRIKDRKLIEIVKDPKQLEELSVKFAKIVEVERPEKDAKGRWKAKGASYVYGDYFVGGGGALMLGLILEQYGFERFTENRSVFTAMEGDTSRAVRHTFTKRPRYGFLTNEATTTWRHLLEIFNSPENVDGEYVQMIIATPTARDGVNIYNAVREWILNPGWHQSGMHQAKSRIFRAMSHQALLEKERRKLIKEGKNPEEATVDVKVYQLVAVSQSSEIEDADASIDQSLYIKAESKEFGIKRMLRIMKEMAVDCMLHYRRNYRPSDMDFSEACDYDTCMFKCYSARHRPREDAEGMAMGQGPKEGEIDFANYDILYSEGIVENCINHIIETMRIRASITLEELYQTVDLNIFEGEETRYKKKFYHIAIERLMDEKRQLLDRFGFPCYLNTDGHTVFIQYDFLITNRDERRQDLAFYSEQLTSIYELSFDKILLDRQSYDQVRVLITLRNIPNPLLDPEAFEEVERIVDAVSFQTKLWLFEDALHRISYDDLENYMAVEGRAGITEDNVPANQLDYAILEKFWPYFFYFARPEEDIENYKRDLHNATIGRRGRKRKDGSLPTVDTKFEGPPDINSVNEKGEPVKVIYAHILYNIKPTNTSYGSNKKILHTITTVRIKPEGESWQTVDNLELEPYLFAINQRRQKDMIPTEGIYGTVDPKGVFRIVDLDSKPGTTTKSGGKVDKRTMASGKVCTSWSIPELIRFLWKDGIIYKEMEDVRIPDTRSQMEHYLIQNKKFANSREDLKIYSTEDLKFFCRWYAREQTKVQLCQVLQNMFEGSGKLIMS